MDGASLWTINPLKVARDRAVRDFESFVALGWFDEDERDSFLIGVFPDAPRYPEPSAN